MIGVGAPLALGLLVTITIWGYMLGRRHESAEMNEQRKERERRERRRVPATVRYELEGKEVLEMGTRANCAEMDEAQRPPMEMEGLWEPAELPAGSWVRLLAALR